MNIYNNCDFCCFVSSAYLKARSFVSNLVPWGLIEVALYGEPEPRESMIHTFLKVDEIEKIFSSTKGLKFRPRPLDDRISTVVKNIYPEALDDDCPSSAGEKQSKYFHNFVERWFSPARMEEVAGSFQQFAEEFYHGLGVSTHSLSHLLKRYLRLCLFQGTLKFPEKCRDLFLTDITNIPATEWLALCEKLFEAGQEVEGSFVEQMSQAFNRIQVVTMLHRLWMAGEKTSYDSAEYIFKTVMNDQGLRDSILDGLTSLMNEGFTLQEACSESALIRAVCLEAIRMRPPLQVISRIAGEPLTVNCRHIESGDRLQIPVEYLSKKVSIVGENPYSFCPFRKVIQEAPQFLPKLGWRPFGVGKTKCPSWAHFMHVMQQLVGTVVWNLETQEAV